MSVELQLLGVKCNLKCSYCYQDPMRLAGNEGGGEYDLEKVKEALLKEGSSSFAFFGGEALLLPLPDFEEMLAFGKQHGKSMSVQTNATIMTDRHFALFKEYQVGIGVSLDGPRELNDAREAKTGAATARTTETSQKNLERLLAEGLSVSLIVTLHKLNASDVHKLGTLAGWINDLKRRGLKYVNLHPLEVDTDQGRALMLSEQENIDAMRFLYRALKDLYVHPFEDMKGALRGQDGNANCVWHACDPYTTAAVRGLDGAGQLSNCGRTNKDGVVYRKSDRPSHVRQLALYFTPQRAGGCGGCRFFAVCKGECPGTGGDQDWRNRTAHCSMLMAVLGDIEAELVRNGETPVSMRIDRGAIESRMLRAWESGGNLSVAQALAGLNQPQSGNVPHGDKPHGDIPHGDHTDAARLQRSGS